MSTLHILQNHAQIEHRGRVVATFLRPNKFGDDDVWHQLATSWGATLQAALLKETP